MTAADMPPGRASDFPDEAGSRVLDSDGISRILGRIAHEILERAHGAQDLVILGIQTRGVPLARRIAARMADIEGVPIPVGSLDITMYRDDLSLRGARPLHATDVPVDGIDGRLVVLDDCAISHRIDVGDVIHLRLAT